MNILKSIFGENHKEEQIVVDYGAALDEAYNEREHYNTDCDEIRVWYRSPFFQHEDLIFYDKLKELKEIVFRRPPIHCTDDIRVDFWNKGKRIHCHACAGCYWRDIKELYDNK